MQAPICAEELCTGCAACANVCPSQCIAMAPNSEGFLYPRIDPLRCTDCGLCKSICPILNPRDGGVPAEQQVYACWNTDRAVRLESSSGGVFSAIAEPVLAKGGVVYGAAYDERMRVRHVAVDRSADLGKLRGSKYVQSDVGLAYVEIRDLLRQGKEVLFSGTPCQVAAVKAVVGEHDEHLRTCDLLCHGVSSPGLFAKYVRYLERRFRSRPTHINFRHKRKGWQTPYTVARFADGQVRTLVDTADSLMYGFVNGITLRSSCNRCSFASFRREGDVSLGDFWGIGDVHPFRHSCRDGVSLVLVNTVRGRHMMQEARRGMYCESRLMEEAKRPRLTHPVPEPEIREEFFHDYSRLEFADLARRYLVDRGLERLVKRVLPREVLFHIRNVRQRVLYWKGRRR